MLVCFQQQTAGKRVLLLVILKTKWSTWVEALYIVNCYLERKTWVDQATKAHRDIVDRNLDKTDTYKTVRRMTRRWQSRQTETKSSLARGDTLYGYTNIIHKEKSHVNTKSINTEIVIR